VLALVQQFLEGHDSAVVQVRRCPPALD
jgi:hypothetical protein